MPKLKDKKRDVSRSKFRDSMGGALEVLKCDRTSGLLEVQLQDWMRGALEVRIKGNLKAGMKALRGQSLIHHAVLGVVLEVVDQDEIAIDPRMLR